MFDRQLDNLRLTIEWAQRDQHLTMFHTAKTQLHQLEACLAHLPKFEQRLLYRLIDEILPMEWPLWMEACRYNDVSVQKQTRVLH